MTRNMTLLTDLYEITMAQSYWSQGKIDTDACFYSFYRDNPFGGGYGVFCGANQIAELVDGFASPMTTSSTSPRCNRPARPRCLILRFSHGCAESSSPSTSAPFPKALPCFHVNRSCA